MILPDLPGFAKSEKPKLEGGVFSFMAKAIRGLMDALDITRASFIGNSLGGGTTLKFALDYPEHVERIVLIGAPGLPIFTPQPAEGIKHLLEYYEKPGPSMEKLGNFLKVMVYDASALTDQLIKERHEASIQPDLVANPIISRSRPFVPEPLWKDVAKITQKTLLVWGRDDRTVTLDNAWMLLKRTTGRENAYLRKMWSLGAMGEGSRVQPARH